MAKAIGLIGNLKGKIGNTVFVTRRGIQIARVYNPTVNNPKSARQQLSRAKFALATETLRPFRRFLRAGWQRISPTYEFQQGISRMVPVSAGIISGASPAELMVDEAPLADVFSAGGLDLFAHDDPSSTSEGRVDVQITMPSGNFFEPDGTAIGCGMVFALWAKALGVVIVDHQPIDTPDAETRCSILVPPIWSGLEVQVYGFAKQIPIAVNGIFSDEEPWMYPARTSKCLYLGTVTVV